MSTIKQSHTFPATAHDLYEALMDSKKHAEFSGEEAKISREVGGKFTAYGDYIEGENLELEKDQKIVQTWRASDWPAGHFSKVTFTFSKKGDETELKFSQEDVPTDKLEEIKQGWIDFYWQPLKEYFKPK